MMNPRLVMLFLFASATGCSSAGTDTEERASPLERTLPFEDAIACAEPGTPPVIQRLVGPRHGFVPREIAPMNGGIWFTDSQGVSLNRLTQDGALSQLAAPFPSESVFDAAVGADENVWFNNVDALLEPHIGRMTPEGVATLFRIPSTKRARHVTRGPDDAIWFTAGDTIGRVAVDGTMTEIAVGARTGDITGGAHATLWFTEPDVNRIGRLTPDGTVSHFDVPTPDSGLDAIVLGPDGQIWFAQTNTGKIGRITHDGLLSEFDVVAPPARLAELATGPDGRVWFNVDTGDYHQTRVGSLSTCGVVTFVDLPKVLDPMDFDPQAEHPAVPYGIAGGDDEVWVTACLEPFETGVVFRLELASPAD
jgi:streptogramin lyase